MIDPMAAPKDVVFPPSAMNSMLSFRCCRAAAAPERELFGSLHCKKAYTHVYGCGCGYGSRLRFTVAVITVTCALTSFMKCLP